jgi:aminoglycoside phosphotransferase (APT) family kinase protein
MARDINRMLAGLRDYLQEGEHLSGITPVSTGHSNETYLLNGIDRVLRMPPSEEGLLPPYDMAQQHAVLAAVGGVDARLPVPRVFELCTDPTIIGDAFFVMEYLDGEAFEYETPSWLSAASSDVPAHMCSQWIGAVTALHRMPSATMRAPHRTVTEEAQHWLGVAQEAEAPSLLLDVLEDLVVEPPRRSGEPTPIHGDPKHGNCLWDKKGKLLALLDWEMAGVGEPLMDLGYIMQFYDQGDNPLGSAGYELSGWWSKQEVIDAWQSATGRTVIDLNRYEALEVGKVAAIISLGYHLFTSGRSKDARFEAWQTVIPGYVAQAARFAEG